MSKLLEVFSQEIEFIKNEEFKKHVKIIIQSLPDYLSKIPSSSTGKYHPGDEISKEGMIRHVKRVVAFAWELSIMEDLEPDHRDILIAGGLIHDILKSGDPQTKWTVKNHPMLAYNSVRDYAVDLYKRIKESTNNLLSEKEIDLVNLLIKLALICLFHSGRWTPKTAYAIKDKAVSEMDGVDAKLCNLMHVADFLASRKLIYDVMQDNFDLTKAYKGEER